MKCIDDFITWKHPKRAYEGLTSAEDAVSQVHLQTDFTDNASTLYAFIYPTEPGSNAERQVSQPFERRVNNAGHSYMGIGIPSHALTTNKDQTVEFLNALYDYTNSLLYKTAEEEEIENVVLVGCSLGGMVAMGAGHNELVDNITLVSGADCLATVVWSSSVLEDLKLSYEGQGYTMEELIPVWEGISPVAYLDQLSEKGVKSGKQLKSLKLIMSSTDAIMPYDRGLIFANEIEERELPLERHTYGPIGHYLTLVAFAKFPGRVHPELKTKKKDAVEEAETVLAL